MIKLEKEGVIMQVSSERMACVFESCGYTRVVEKSTALDPVIEEPRHEEPQNLEDKTDEEPQDKKKYSKSDITRMSTANLKELAKTLSIEVTEESTGKVLKEQIIGKLGL